MKTCLIIDSICLSASGYGFPFTVSHPISNLLFSVLWLCSLHSLLSFVFGVGIVCTVVAGVKARCQRIVLFTLLLSTALIVVGIAICIVAFSTHCPPLLLMKCTLSNWTFTAFSKCCLPLYNMCILLARMSWASGNVFLHYQRLGMNVCTWFRQLKQNGILQS